MSSKSQSKRIAILGATGPSGQCLVKQALERGHQVSALVRNPDKLPDDIKNHAAFKACKVTDINSADQIAEHLTGIDVVMSTLGTKEKKFALRGELHFYTPSAKAMVEAMKKKGVKRIVVITSWALKRDSNTPFMFRFMYPVVLGKILDDMDRMESFLASSGVEYTCVRPPSLTDGPVTQLPIAVEDAQFVPANKVTTRFHNLPAIARNDVARFMLDCLDSDAYVNKCPAIVT